MEFNFNIQKSAIFQALGWNRYPLFKWSHNSKNYLYCLTGFLVLIFLFFIFFEFLPDRLLSVILGLAIISAVFSIIALLIESFFNLKLRNPKIENNLSEVILNPEGFNLAELLSFEVAESCWKTIRFANIKKLSEVDSHPIFYFLLKENKNLEFIFSRATINYNQIKG